MQKKMSAYFSNNFSSDVGEASYFSALFLAFGYALITHLHRCQIITASVSSELPPQKKSCAFNHTTWHSGKKVGRILENVSFYLKN
jgi:hypothetical protein